MLSTRTTKGCLRNTANPSNPDNVLGDSIKSSKIYFVGTNDGNVQLFHPEVGVCWGPRGKKEKKLKLDEDAKKKAWPGEPSLDRRRLPDGQNPDSPLQNALESVWNRKPVHCHANPL